MFNDKQNEILANELDSSRIKSRQKGNITLSYLEGFSIIETANNIFGFGNWNYTVSKLEMVSQELNQNSNNVICYKAIINIVVNDTNHSKQVVREDVGFGTGIARTLAEAHEGGAKEAVTDGIKRTLRSFGNQFGNSLYDKSRNHQNNQQQSYQPPQQAPQQQNYQQAPTQTPQQPNQPQDYSALFNFGLTVMEQGQNLVVIGENLFNNKELIKNLGFRFDPSSKSWWKPNQQQAA